MARRFRRRPPAWLWLTVASVLVLASRWLVSQRDAVPVLIEGDAVVRGVIDGRTLTVEVGGEQPGLAQVRLLSIELRDDAAAREWIQQNLVGEPVRIELDKRRRDRDGAQLAYVYWKRTFVNAELVRLGFARHDAYPGDSASHAKLLREAK
jgi:endonuclease YncB( thermonuclease family)